MTKDNILIDYISHDIFRKTRRLDHGSEVSATVEYMILDVRNMGGIQDIKIGKTNSPSLDHRYFAYIKIEGKEKAIISHDYPMFKVSNFIADHIGKNLIWIDI